MVIVNRIKEIKALQAALKRSGFSTAALHGEHSQRERELATLAPAALLPAGATVLALSAARAKAK